MSSINYNLSLIKGIGFDIDGVLSPSSTILGANGLPVRMVNLKDEQAIQMAIKAGIEIIIISGARPSGIEERLRSLGIPTIKMHCLNKEHALREWMKANKFSSSEVAYCGDDIADLGPMAIAGLRVSPLDGCNDIKILANYISPLVGGGGVARDLLEQILRAQEKWPRLPEIKTINPLNNDV